MMRKNILWMLLVAGTLLMAAGAAAAAPAVWVNGGDFHTVALTIDGTIWTWGAT